MSRVLRICTRVAPTFEVVQICLHTVQIVQMNAKGLNSCAIWPEILIYDRHFLKRIHHWCSVGTGKFKPEGPPFLWETRLCRVSHWNGGPEGWGFPVPLCNSDRFLNLYDYRRPLPPCAPYFFEVQIPGAVARLVACTLCMKTVAR